MADRSITIRLGADVKGLQAGFRTAQQSVKDFGSQTQKFVQNNRQSLEQVGQAGMLAGGVLAAGFGLAVTKFAAFDKSMSSVRAATHETEGNMDLLRDAAVRAGADTAFSAEEAARGIEEMAKAGVSTTDILEGGLDGALSLAAAGALDVGEAAELAATAMTQFGLAGDDIPHIADLLAAGAGKAQGSVQDMGAALKQAGLVADQTGLTIEETTGGLAAFASAGLVGSDAGTSFKAMLQRLNPQSEAAATLMSDLGLSAYDSQGNFIGLSEYAGQLQSALGDMSAEQRNATMSTLFGSDAVRAASVLYEQGSEGVQKWEDAVNDAGYAAETAALMQDNLAGDLEKLGGAFDTVFLQAGSGANDALRGLVQTLEEFVDWVGEIPGPVLSTVGVLAGLTGGAALVGGAFLTVVPRIADTVSAFKDLSAASPRAASGLGKVAKAAGAAAIIGTVGVALAKIVEASYMDDIDTGMGKVAEALAEVSQNGPGAEEALDSLFQDRDGGDLIRNVDDIDSALNRTFNKSWDRSFNDWGEGIMNTLTGVKGSSQILGDSWDRMDEQLATMVSGGNADAAAEAFARIEAAAEEQGVDIERLAEIFPAYKDALAGAAAEQANAAASADNTAAALEAEAAQAEAAAQASQAVQEALAEIGVSAEGTVSDLTAFTNALVSAGLLSLSSRDSARQYQASIDALNDSIATNGTTLDTNTEAGRANEAALDGIASAGLAYAEALASETDALGKNVNSQEDVQAALQQTYDDYYANALAMTGNADAAEALTRKVLGIPDNVTIDSFMAETAKIMAEATTGAAEVVPDHVGIDSWMSEAAKLTADATKKSAEDIPNQETIDSWMSDAAFLEAVKTRAAALGIPEHEAISSFMSSAARNEADATTAEILGIPEGASVSSFMSNYARVEAQNTTAAINAIPKNVEVLITTRAHKINTETSDRGYSQNGGVGGLATGGAIYGPGSGTSDTAGLFRLSNGEHVLTAAEVKAMGGQSAVYGFRSQLRSGVPGYALGGEVGRQVPAMAVAGSSTSGGGFGGDHYHTHIDAAPGVAYQYAKDVAVHAVQRKRDMQAAYGNRSN